MERLEKILVSIDKANKRVAVATAVGIAAVVLLKAAFSKDGAESLAIYAMAGFICCSGLAFITSTLLSAINEIIELKLRARVSIPVLASFSISYILVVVSAVVLALKEFGVLELIVY